jgi:hypothetical protein
MLATHVAAALVTVDKQTGAGDGREGSQPPRAVTAGTADCPTQGPRCTEISSAHQFAKQYRPGGSNIATSGVHRAGALAALPCRPSTAKGRAVSDRPDVQVHSIGWLPIAAGDPAGRR